jgi:predicted amidohydrolase
MDQSLTISLVQTSLYWENKEANRKALEEKIFSIKEKTELVLLPEMFSTGFSMQPALLAETMEGDTVTWMKQVAAKKKIILAGSLIIEEEGKFFNRMIWMLPNGQYGIYDKRHRFGFAGEDTCYTAGQKRVITSVKGWKVNLQVCYDLRFPVWARQTLNAGSEPEYDLIVYVANWPERRIHAWKTLLQARAIENQCFVAAVNRVGEDGNGIIYSGDSMIIDPMGEILCTGNEEAVYTYTITKEHLATARKKFPFLKDADAFRIISN